MDKILLCALKPPPFRKSTHIYVKLIPFLLGIADILYLIICVTLT